MPVYLTLGNHEGFPVNAFPTDAEQNSVVSGAWLYEVGDDDDDNTDDGNGDDADMTMIDRVLPTTDGPKIFPLRRENGFEGKAPLSS